MVRHDGENKGEAGKHNSDLDTRDSGANTGRLENRVGASRQGMEWAI